MHAVHVLAPPNDLPDEPFARRDRDAAGTVASKGGRDDLGLGLGAAGDDEGGGDGPAFDPRRQPDRGLRGQLRSPTAAAVAILVVSTRDTVHSVLFLVLDFLGVAALYVLLGAEFLAVIQILVYAGGIVVLYLFVVLAAGVFVDAWGLVVGTTLAFVVWVTLVNFVYLLAQIVIAADDRPISGLGALVATIRDTEPGTTVTFTVIRDGKQLTLVATIGQRTTDFLLLEILSVAVIVDGTTTTNPDGTNPGPWRTIVGVVSTVRMMGPFNNPGVDESGYYVPYYASPFGPVLTEPAATQFATVVVKPGAGETLDSALTALRRIVARHQAPSLSKSLWQLLSTLTAFAAVCTGMYFSLAVSYALTLALSVLAAGLLVRIFIIFHDCGHGSFFRSGVLNDIVGFFAGLLTFTPYYHWRWEHSLHHATSGNLDKRGVGDIWTMTVQEYLEASRWKRLTNAWSCARCGCMILSATTRSRRRSRASYTVAMPPRASWESTR